MELVTNAGWILTKNGIIKKIKLLLAGLQEEQVNVLQSKKKKLPQRVFHFPPKISKGENYKGLPYLILDHPRVFEKNDILAIRTMFWWGHFFSVTLHLAGQYKKMFEKKILSSFSYLRENEFFLCINEEQWEHHFEENNYREVNKMPLAEFETHLRSASFIKIAKKIPIENWGQAELALLSYFNTLIGVMD